MRVTIDEDRTDFWGVFRLTVAWLVLRAMRGEVYVRQSAGGRWHMKAHGLKISYRTSLLLRCLLGDDRERVKKDVRRLEKPKQILWTEKDGKPAGKWKRI